MKLPELSDLTALILLMDLHLVQGHVEPALSTPRVSAGVAPGLVRGVPGTPAPRGPSGGSWEGRLRGLAHLWVANAHLLQH